MGFYGNIGNVRHTHFVFDDIFPNRTTMDQAAVAGTDNIFSGRFVLVKYDNGNDLFVSDTLLGFLNPSDGYVYKDNQYTIPYIYTTFNHVANPSSSNWSQYYYFDGKYYSKLPSAEYFVSGQQNYYTASYVPGNYESSQIVGLNQLVRLRDPEFGTLTGTYYKCTGTTVGQKATWGLVLPDEDFSDYVTNYNLDRTEYGDDFDIRGYDATVWQKVYSEGYGRFVLIARLNGGLIPEIQLIPGAPSLEPTSPYIDAYSAENLYRIKVPSMYGFQVKEVDPEEDNPLSDQNTIVTRIEYDNDTQSYIRTDQSVDAAIYYNRAGADKQYRVIDETTSNEILIEPTGESGRVYYDNEGNAITEDILELTVHMPMIGNMIADGYDLIYGYNEKVNDSDTQTRPTDVAWVDGSASEVYKIQGNSVIGGKTHALETLAGTLNTLHDRLGQIIVKTDVLPAAEQMSSDLIYEHNNKFYRRGVGGSSEIITNDKYTYTYIPGVTASNFEYNKYYVYTASTLPEGVTPSPATSYESGKYYFIKNLNDVRYHKIQPRLIQYYPETYYRKLGDDYIRDNSSPNPTDPEALYYTVTPSNPKTFTTAYSNDGTFYTKDLDSGIYTPSRESVPTIGTTYYLVTESEQKDNNVIYYVPGVFYYKDEHNNFILDQSNTTTMFRQYYILTFSDVPHYGLDGNGNAIQYYEMISSQLVTNIVDKPANVNNYYFKDNQNRWIPFSYIEEMGPINGKSPYTIARTYYTINAPGYTELFLANVYYQHTSDGSYVKASQWGGVTAQYYELTTTQLNQVFYVPNRYYYKQSENSYPPAKDANKVYTDYYTKTSVYVDVDTTGQCPHGFEWNDYSPYIPPSITLYYKTDAPSQVEITGISNGSSSINGLILALSKEYDFNNLETRNEATFRGCANRLNDAMYRIKELVPGQILTVNDFGQIISMSLSDLKTALANV